MGAVAKLLIIAGSDSGGGAGIQADLKTASALGVYASTAITAITAQNTVGVQRVAVMEPDLVAAQIASVLDDIGADAVKIGMLGSVGLIRAVADALAGFRGPVVLDPVMVAKSGDTLLERDAVQALREHLLPLAHLLTPNLPEAAQLLGQPQAETSHEVAAQGRALCQMGARAVLMKGGHGAGPVCRDLLVGPAEALQQFSAPRQTTQNTHGTGCTLSSAIAAELALGRPLYEAVERAHAWLQRAIACADRLQVGRGYGPVHHFHEVWP
ncbi:bifunctional hydroxymethylpyrimidine kinase/phosphomethylpyrimidine kinase [Rhodobacteraceae bacterium]|nr:bifunctional hydroxymethylpyrimidine kinase/phosphomethylpyrimidine kinase [Paracoccaceae bacterium]